MTVLPFYLVSYYIFVITWLKLLGS